MSYQPNIQPNLNLSSVGGEDLPRPKDTDVLPATRPENLPNPELTPSQMPQAALPVNPIVADLPFNDNTPQPIQAQDSQSMPTTSPISPIGRDLIGKEWILRAKQISAQSRDDPYRQSLEFGKLKAEYIKQRYNLTLKSS